MLQVQNLWNAVTRRGSQVSASDCFEFWICFREPKNKIHVFFYSGLFSYLGSETNLQSYKIFRCSSPIALVFGYVLEERKIRK